MAEEVKDEKGNVIAKVGTDVEAEWTRILEAQEKALLNSKINRELAEVVIGLAKKHISEEEKKN